MQQALQMHHAGRLTEAQTLYQRVLALHPAHLPALQMLGVLMFQTGRQEEGAGQRADIMMNFPHCVPLAEPRGESYYG